MEKVKEDIALQVIERSLATHGNVRVVIAPHPVQGKVCTCVPYLDLAEALTVPKDTIYKIISRSERVRKYCGMYIMSTPGGPQSTLCVFEEGVLHIIMKLQPTKCSNPDVGEKLDEIQDEMVQILRDALHGYQQKIDHDAVTTAKTLAHLISVINKTTDPECLDLLYEQVELISGRKFKRARQLRLPIHN